MNLSLYFHTLRYLRPQQIYGRIWNKINPCQPDLHLSPELRLLTRQWIKPAEHTSTMLAPMNFCFLNVKGQVSHSSDWNTLSQDKLWLYNLHYFDDLNAVNSSIRTTWHQSLISRWIKENPPALGNGWEPYPTSLRIVNWIKWALVGNSLETEWVSSLSVQIRWLSKHLEYHLLGNHLFANAKALIFAGLFFEGNESSRWLSKGLKLLQKQLSEQILPDGGHFERSPMYHAIILEDLLDLINVAQAHPDCISIQIQNEWKEIAKRMLRWLIVMSHPDGKMSFFNDAAFGIASEYPSLMEYAQRLAIPISNPKLEGIESLPDSGYVRLQNERAVLICDVAPIGPDYLPGHAHADTLSFEMSLDGRRVIVNSGTSTYSGGRRNQERGTALHNTVLIDNINSSEIWSQFRVARRAKPFSVSWGQNDSVLWVEGSHNGYLHLPGKVIHCRNWKLKENGLDILDKIDGTFHSGCSFLHFHPDAEIMSITTQPPAKTETLDATWHSEFGKSVPNRKIRMTFQGNRLLTSLNW